MGRHYGVDYDRYIGLAGDFSPERWSARRKTLAKYKSCGALLDLGCSSGSFLESVKGSAWKLYGVEMSFAVARRAEERSGAQVFVGDILDAPFRAGSFDVVTCFDVLEHVYEPRKVMEKVEEWLKPGGIFYVLVPNIDSAEARVFKSYWYGLELPRHLSHFSPTSLRHLAKSVRLEEVSLVTGRNSALEASMRYISDDILGRFGILRTSLSKAKAPGLPWRVFRSALRLTLFPVLWGMISLAGPGESIHAVFRKSP
jgi:2-polyprenyl-3-methyl-5-hydroxy-6-metoxy-1,4-benzoquinol methylase